MKILSIETSSRMAGVALMEEGRLLAAYSIFLHFKHAERLLPLIDTLLKETQIALRDIHGIAVSIGPGSFTGVRVGLATAKGLALAYGSPLLPVSTLEAMALPFCARGTLVASVMTAKKETVYFSIFDYENEKGKVYPDTVAFFDEMVSVLRDRISSKVPLVLVIGEDAALKERLSQVFEKEGVIYTVPFPLATTVAELGWRKMIHGEGQPADAVVPVYLAPFQPSVFALPPANVM